ncbi:S9 family peptidase [Serratia sp. DD3]|uniref:alpha/beta hydrolase family protein n=1 Tax=Serratia sp. DD3 TaxID=1410619 RepID=UPI0003C51BBF|nr:alpha/beta fold hydrolase [Serratia sp. DD3]KEY60854.1 putative dienelactone hydrolase [Serratia sp. DD3]
MKKKLGIFFILIMMVVGYVTAADKTKIAYGEDPNQYGELYLPKDKAKGLVVMIHGGYYQPQFTLSYLDPASQDLVARGYAVWSIEYRRMTQGGGWQTTSQDILAAINHLDTLSAQYDLPKNIVLVGHSVGGQFALWAASRATQPSNTFGMLKPKIAGVVSLAGVSDLLLLDKGHRSAHRETPITQFIGADPAVSSDILKKVSPIELLPLGIKQILVHGDMDINVPIGVSSLYQDKAIAAGDDVSMVIVPLADHFTLLDPALPFWKETVTAIDTLIK